MSKVWLGANVPRLGEGADVTFVNGSSKPADFALDMPDQFGAAERIAERPLAGWGAAATRHVPGGSGELPGGGTYISLHTHNGTLQVWLELGAVGAGLLAALAAALALAAAATPSRGDAVLALAGFAAAGTVFNLSFGIWQEDWLAMLALTAALLAATRRPAGRRD